MGYLTFLVLGIVFTVILTLEFLGILPLFKEEDDV